MHQQTAARMAPLSHPSLPPHPTMKLDSTSLKWSCMDAVSSFTVMEAGKVPLKGPNVHLQVCEQTPPMNTTLDTACLRNPCMLSRLQFMGSCHNSFLLEARQHDQRKFASLHCRADAMRHCTIWEWKCMSITRMPCVPA